MPIEVGELFRDVTLPHAHAQCDIAPLIRGSFSGNLFAREGENIGPSLRHHLFSAGNLKHTS